LVFADNLYTRQTLCFVGITGHCQHWLVLFCFFINNCFVDKKEYFSTILYCYIPLHASVLYANIKQTMGYDIEMDTMELTQALWQVLKEFNEWAQDNADRIKKAFEDYVDILSTGYQKTREAHGYTEAENLQAQKIAEVIPERKGYNRLTLAAFNELLEKYGKPDERVVNDYEGKELACISLDEPLLRLARFHDVILELVEEFNFNKDAENLAKFKGLINLEDIANLVETADFKPVINSLFYKDMAGVSVEMLYDQNDLKIEKSRLNCKELCKPQEWWQSLKPKTTEKRPDEDPEVPSLEELDDILGFILEQDDTKRDEFRMLVIEEAKRISKKYKYQKNGVLEFIEELMGYLYPKGTFKNSNDRNTKYNRLAKNVDDRTGNSIKVPEESRVTERYKSLKKTEKAKKIVELTQEIPPLKSALQKIIN